MCALLGYFQSYRSVLLHSAVQFSKSESSKTISECWNAVQANFVALWLGSKRLCVEVLSGCQVPAFVSQNVNILKPLVDDEFNIAGK